MSGISNVTPLRASNTPLYSGMKGMHQHSSAKSQEITNRAVAPESKRLATTEHGMDGNCGMKGMHDKGELQQKGNSIDFRL